MYSINGVSSTIALTEINAQSVKSSKTALNSQTPIENGSDELIWCQLGREYDVHDINTEQRAALSQKLYDAGQISLADHAILSFDGERNLPSGSTFLTEPTSNGGYDIISEFKARIELDKQMNNEQNAQNNQRILDILNHLESAAAKPIEIVA